MNLRTLLILMSLAGSGTAVTMQAQTPIAVGQSDVEKKCTGTVKDDEGNEVIGASVLIKGTRNGVVTDSDGNFVIDRVKLGETIVISYLGYKTVEVKFDGSPLNIKLTNDNKALDEVVVVGYGVQKKSSMTAAVSSISKEDLTKQVTSNIASAIQGRAPGVEILQKGGDAGGNVSILIRGAGSFGSTEPLYIIDGAVSSNGLNTLNPNDIQSIEILKDGSAAAIYGSRAANGVVLVTTKNGQKGATKVEITGSYTLQTLSKKLDFMNADQWRTYANMVADNSPAYNKAPQNVNPSNPDYSQDWQDIYYRNAAMYNLGASVSGGGEFSTFATSLAYTKQNGIIIQSDYEKYNARLNGTYKKGIFEIFENLSLAHTRRHAGPTARIIEIPTIPVEDEYGRYVSTPKELGYSLINADISNPLADMYVKNSVTHKTSLTGSFGVGVQIFKGLSYKLNVAGSYYTTNGYTHTPQYATYWDENGSPDSRFSHPYTSLSESRNEGLNYNIDNLLTYKGSFGNHNFDVLLGTSWMREFYRTMSISSGVNDLGSPSVTTYNGAGTVGSNEANSALLSFFARVNYNYLNRYLLSLSIRSDESSKFAKGHRVGYFPSVSAGWNVHEEKFFKIPWMSKLKLRASYGQLGANFIDPYSFLNLAYGPVPAIMGGKRQYGYVTRLAQGDLKWETAVSSNFGIETAFLNNSLTFTAEYFYRKNRDLLAPLESLPSSGQTIVINDGIVPYYNTASVENRGFEFTLGYRKRWNDFSVDVQGNITFLKNKVLKLGEGVQPIRGALISTKFNDRPTVTREGLPIGTFWGYKVVGVDDQGDFLFEGSDGNPISAKNATEKDKQVIGNPIPDFTYGLNVNLTYKNWDFTAFFQGSQGNDIFAAGKYMMYFSYNNNNLVDALNAWTPTNKSQRLPIAKTDNNGGVNALPSTFYVEDGSYLRCKNLQVGYSFNQQMLKHLRYISSLRIYASVQNLFTITKYPLYDPEVSSNALFNRGVDGLGTNSPTINARSYNIGFTVTL